MAPHFQAYANRTSCVFVGLKPLFADAEEREATLRIIERRTASAVPLGASAQDPRNEKAKAVYLERHGEYGYQEQ
jgi:hypothetical protein